MKRAMIRVLKVALMSYLKEVQEEARVLDRWYKSQCMKGLSVEKMLETDRQLVHRAMLLHDNAFRRLTRVLAKRFPERPAIHLELRLPDSLSFGEWHAIIRLVTSELIEKRPFCADDNIWLGTLRSALKLGKEATPEQVRKAVHCWREQQFNQRVCQPSGTLVQHMGLITSWELFPGADGRR